MTSERTVRPRRPRRKAPDFYTTALNEAEQVALEFARDVDGIDEEIAVLRVKLRASLSNDPKSYQQFLKGIELLVRAVGARYRISGKSEDDLYESALGVVKGIGELLTSPEDSRG